MIEGRAGLAARARALGGCHAERKAQHVSFARCAFVCDPAAARAVGDELQQTAFRTCNADHKSPVLIAMLAAERNGSVAVAQPRDIRRIARIET